MKHLKLPANNTSFKVASVESNFNDPEVGCDSIALHQLASTEILIVFSRYQFIMGYDRPGGNRLSINLEDLK
jgi:hypothetical protein